MESLQTTGHPSDNFLWRRPRIRWCLDLDDVQRADLLRTHYSAGHDRIIHREKMS